ncbi:translation elongation factor 4, partial [Sulfurihydrogenibium yellowstonense]
MEKIRNFSIIAHVDHGKSTLADRLIEFTGGLEKREMKEQLLDTLDIERERGITIKLQAVRLKYKDYTLHLIDTPGHVDFGYEVSRSLAACEGALLLIDATQGIEAQTIATFWQALNLNLEIIPVINKIDLPSADVERIKTQIAEVLGLDQEGAILASGKAGIGIEDILEAIVKRIPPPKGDENKPLKALIFDSYYDPYRGAVAFIRVIDGEVKVGTRIRLMSTGKEFEVTEVGAQTPKMTKLDSLKAGDVGYVAAAIKDVRDIRVGDTITDAKRPTDKPVEGFRPAKPMVYAGLYPTGNTTFEDMRDALERYSINDAALTYEVESSPALGMGFRCGFLGLLHLEIVQERLEREYGIELITTAPNVIYKVITTKGEEIEVRNPSQLPNPNEIDKILEPYIEASIITPSEYVGSIMQLVQEKRGIQKGFEYIDQKTVLLRYEIPLGEVLFDFHDKLKTV